MVSPATDPGSAGSGAGSLAWADWPMLACILALALGVRLFLMPDALSYDEAQHYLVAKSPLAADFVREFRLRAHPPLAYLLMKPFVALGPSVYWVRMAPLLCGLASIVVVYFLLGKVLRAQTPALVGTLLIALAPIFVKQSIEARHYSLCLLLLFASLWLWQRMSESNFQVRSQHWMLGGLQLLALFAEYSAAFAVAALSLVIYLPLLKRELMRGQGGWSEIAHWALPQAAVAGAALWLFVWQFEGAVPSYSHTEAAVYLTSSSMSTSGEGGASGRSLLDIGAVLAFLWRQTGFFQNAILPPPLGLVVLFAPVLAFAPWLRDDSRARMCRLLAIYAGVSLLLSMAASLLGFFPFGGRPRHNAALVPGIVLASYLSIALALGNSALRPIGRRVAAGLLVAVILLGLGLGLRPGLAGREGYQRHSQSFGAANYREAPASIVTNWRGRNYASWWFLPSASPRQTRADAREQVFDHDGVRVIQTESPRLIAARAVSEARRTGECWILLSHFLDGDTQQLASVVSNLQSRIAKSSGVELDFVGESHFFPPLVVLKLRASGF